MAKKKKLVVPGSIYSPKNTNKLYIKLYGKRIATGLEDTIAGRKLAETMLMQMYLNAHNINDEPARLTAREAFAEYMEYCRVMHQPKTIINYELAFNTFVKKDFELTKENVEKCVIDYLKHTTHSDISINTYLNQFQIFLNFCSRRDYCKQIEVNRVFKRRDVEVKPQSWTQAEINELIIYFDSKGSEISLLIQFMLETGARMIDALTLEWSQVQSSSIVWRNKKSKKPEERPVSTRAVELLSILRSKNKEKVFSWQYSSATAINKQLRKALDELCIEKKNRSFQEFRVTFRMRLLEKGVPDVFISWLLRHKDYSSAQDTMRKNYTPKEVEFVREYLE